MGEAQVAGDDVLLYFPADFPLIVNRVLDILNPTLILLTESELWPNLVRKAKARGIPIVLVNGRISESSFRGYRRLRVFFARVLRWVDLLLVQSETDRRRLVELGADPAAVRVMGSAKYDVTRLDAAGREGIGQALRACSITPASLIFVGGSTWKGEEGILLDLLKRLRAEFPNLKLILVPRHAERRAEVEAEIRARGLTHVRRSEIGKGGAAETAAPDVLLVDTTGELKDFYAAADVIFVGKSLASRGGQNVIEPAALGKPVIVGPYMSNFEAVVADFLAADAIVQVPDAAALEAAARALLADRDRCQEMGRRAKAVVEAKKGAVRESVRAFLTDGRVFARQPAGDRPTMVGACAGRYGERRTAGKAGWTDDYDWKRRNVDEVVARNRVPARSRFLELGCGAGNITLDMAGKGFEAYGVDVVPQAIEWAREKMGQSSLRADFRVGNVTDLSSYPDDFFDLVYDGDCLWMVIGADRRPCLRAVFRILRPGGVFFARAHLVNEQVKERHYVTPHVYFDPERRVSTIDDVPMYYFSSESEFKREVMEAGFEIRRLEKTPRKEGDDPFVAGGMFLDAVKRMS